MFIEITSVFKRERLLEKPQKPSKKTSSYYPLWFDSTVFRWLQSFSNDWEYWTSRETIGVIVLKREKSKRRNKNVA